MKYFWLLPLLLLISSCTPKLTRENYKEPPQKNNQDCIVNYVFKKTEFSGLEFLGKAKYVDRGFDVNCSFDDIMTLFKNEACNLGANIVYIYDIKLPGARSTCYQAKAQFYKGNFDTVKLAQIEQKKEPAKTIVPIKPLDTLIFSNSIFGEFGIGGLFSGMRHTLAKDGLDPKPDNLTLICFGAGYTYYHDKIGFEIKFHYLMTKADKDDYQSLYIYDDFLLSGGIVLVPFQFREANSNSTGRIEIRSGVNYDIFSFDPKLNLEELGSANGVGFYADLGINFFNNTNGLFWGTFLEYNYLYAKYTGAEKPIDGNNLIFYFRLGKVF